MALCSCSGSTPVAPLATLTAIESPPSATKTPAKTATSTFTPAPSTTPTFKATSTATHTPTATEVNFACEQAAEIPDVLSLDLGEYGVFETTAANLFISDADLEGTYLREEGEKQINDFVLRGGDLKFQPSEDITLEIFVEGAISVQVDGEKWANTIPVSPVGGGSRIISKGADVVISIPPGGMGFAPPYLGKVSYQTGGNPLTEDSTITIEGVEYPVQCDFDLGLWYLDAADIPGTGPVTILLPYKNWLDSYESIHRMDSNSDNTKMTISFKPGAKRAIKIYFEK